MIVQSLLIVVLGYLLGSIPSAYIAGRLIKGIDIRDYGSGNVGGSNVWMHVAKWAIFVVGIFDVAKGAIPTWLGLRLFGMPVAILVGLAAIAGHSWSIYLGFTGGRGLSTTLGMLLVLFPIGSVYLLLALGIGRAIRKTAIFALLAVASLPVLALILEGQLMALASLAMLLLIVVKRLEANRLPLPPKGEGRREVLINRLLMDRDVKDWEAWVKRTPSDKIFP
jgi:glycerol-3-phosphate acyltransferase PlsY